MLWGHSPLVILNDVLSLSYNDNSTWFTWVYPLQKKPDMCATVKTWAKNVQKQLGYEVCEFQSDMAGEFMSDELANWLTSQGIEHRFAIVASPQENGVAERKGVPRQGTLQKIINMVSLSGPGKRVKKRTHEALIQHFEWLIVLDGELFSLLEHVRSGLRC